MLQLVQWFEETVPFERVPVQTSVDPAGAAPPSVWVMGDRGDVPIDISVVLLNTTVALSLKTHFAYGILETAFVPGTDNQAFHVPPRGTPSATDWQRVSASAMLPKLPALPVV